MNNNAYSLSDKHCAPCEGRIPPLTTDEYNKLLIETPEWSVVDGIKIKRDFKFKDFKQALGFVNKVGELAEAEGHHPDISLHNWNKVLIALTTHAIKGLSENDFIMASKIDLVYSNKA